MAVETRPPEGDAMDVKFNPEALEDFLWIKANRPAMHKKILRLLSEISEMGLMNGTGKPKMLHGELSGWYSRRISKGNRLVYRIHRNKLEILSCKGHYDES